MKTFKRVLSSFLALLMIFSSVSVLSVSAAGDGSKNATFYTKFFAENAEGEWVEVTQVKAGTTVKARTYIESDYSVGTSNIFWVYSKNFMELDLTGWSQTGVRYEFPSDKNPVINPSATSFPTANGWKGSFTTATEPAGVSEGDASDNLIYDEYLTEDFFDDKGWIALRLENGKPAVLNADEYLFEFTFKVKSAPEGEGFLYVEEEAVQDTDWYSYAYTFIGEARTSASFSSIEGWEYDYTYSFQDKNTITLYTETSTTYTQNVYTMDTEGNYGAPVEKSVTGEIGATVKSADYAVPAGFSLGAQSTESVVLADDGSSVMNIYLDRNKYSVSFDGVATEQYYDAVIAPATAAEKEGYAFDGWYAGATKLSATDKVPVGGATYTAKYNALDVGYTVNKYFMNTDGTYADAVSQAFPGKTEAVVSYADEGFEGFTLDTTKGTLSGTVTGDGKLVLDAYYARNLIDVTIDGETTQKYYGSTVAEPATPDAEAGYEFDKWVDGNGDEITSWPITVGTDEIVIESTFKKIPRTVTYVYVGAPAGYTAPAAKTAYIDDVIELPALPEVEGYAVGDWVISGDVDGKVGTTDVTVTSTWTLNAYKVTLDVDGGEADFTSVTKNYGETLALSELPEVTKTGYDFLGWTVNGADATFPMTIKGDVTLKAKLALHNYNISYEFTGNKPAGVAVPDATTGTMGSVVPQPTFAAVEGYTFEGWTIADVDGNEITDGKVGTADVIVTGKWTLNRHQLSFDAGVDGVTVSGGTRPYNAEIVAPGTDISALKPGYRFDGWKDSATGSIVSFPFAMPDRDVELVAVWTPIERTITYVYVGAPEGYTAPAAQKGIIGGSIELPALPTDAVAYNISAWVVEGADENGLIGTSDVTVTATWTKKTYVVQFYADEEGTIPFGDAVIYEHGDLLVYPANDPEAPIGKVFDFWSEDEGVAVTGDKDVVPVFYDIDYFVTVLGFDGIEFDETAGWTATYGEEITLADLADLETEVENYVFTGWYYNGEKMTADTVITVTDDVVIEAQYEGAEAKLVFKAEGALFANGTDTVEVGIKIDDEITEDMYPAVPDYEGHTFVRWSEDLVGQTMTETEVVITIKWSKNTYSVKFVNGLTNEETVVTGLYGDPVAMPELPVAEGYTFAWDATVTSIPARNENGELMANGGTMTITAVPTANVYTVMYVVGTTPVYACDAEFGSDIDATYVPTSIPAGYEFLGWSLDEEATAVGALGKVPADNVRVYAVLKAKGDTKYTVEIYKENLEGGYDLASSVEYFDGTADQVAPYVVEEIEGFVFNAEASILDELVNGEGTTVLEVYYDRKVIKVVINGAEQDVLFGETIDLPDDVDDGDEGTAFDGWVDENGNKVSDPYTVPDTDAPIVLNPTFKNNTYTVTYKVDGVEINSVDYEYTATINAYDPAAFIPEGYYFVEWAPALPATMPANDLEVEAVYKAYTNVTYKVEIYKENLEGAHELAETLTFTDGTTGELAPYVVEEIKGFVFNAEASILDELVAGDNSTVLEVYYDRKVITVVINGEEKEVLFGETIDLPDDLDDNNPGTEFDVWLDENGIEVSDPFIVPDSDEPIIIYPFYKNNSFEVTFVDELSGTSKTNTLEYSTKIPNPGTPNVEGYEFNGWFTKDGEKYVAGTTTVPAANVTYYAKFTGLEVTYIVNVYFEELDGSWSDVQAEELPGIAGEKAVYTETFEGFTLDTAISTTEAVIKGDGTTELVIYFTRNDVTYTVDGEEKTVPYGTEINADDLSVKVENGYKLDKWTDAEGNEVTFPVVIEGNEVFVPVIVKDSFTVKFQLENGTVIDEATAEFGSDYAAPEAPEAEEGHTFAGWLDKSTNTYYDGKIPAKDAVYVAYYTNNDEAEYTVNIYIMNTSGVEELSGSYKSTAAIGTTQTVVPGTVAYCTLADKSNTSCVVLADNSATINLYFVRGLYTVSFDGVETEVYAGAAIPVPADPTDAGKKFTGWTPAVPEVMPEEDIAFESTWEDVEYTITYIINDTEVVHTYLYGATVTPYVVTEAPAGLVFDGWYGTIPATMPAENIVVSAIFKAAAYTVTYLDADGNVYEAYSVAYGAEIPVPAINPEKAYHEFIGWDNIPESMPNHDLTITPVFAPIDVRLIPVEGSSTVIDRERMIIYGLEENLNAKVLDELFLDYTGNGRLVIKPVTEGTSRYGTGAVVELYNNENGSLVETFHIVVFGDLNGDSVVNGIDVSIASDEAFWLTSWSDETSDEYNEFRTIAANLDSKNSVIDSTDVSDIKNYVISIVDIDQTTGKIVRS